MSVFLRGLLVGLAIAAPIGPIGVMRVRRTLANGRGAGFVSGLGAATADGIYGAIAGLGLTAISTALVGGQLWLRPVGGLFLCVLCVHPFLATPGTAAGPDRSRGLLWLYASTLVLTLTNPMTVLSFAAIFAGLGISVAWRYGAATQVVTGVLCGSALWWLALSSTVGIFKQRLSLSGLRWVNRLSGAIITGFGIVALPVVR